MVARLDAKLQTASHAGHDLEAHSGCDGDKDLSDAVFQFTDIVIKLHKFFLLLSRGAPDWTYHSRRHRRISSFHTTSLDLLALFW